MSPRLPRQLAEHSVGVLCDADRELLLQDSAQSWAEYRQLLGRAVVQVVPTPEGEAVLAWRR